MPGRPAAWPSAAWRRGRLAGHSSLYLAFEDPGRVSDRVALLVAGELGADGRGEVDAGVVGQLEEEDGDVGDLGRDLGRAAPTRRRSDCSVILPDEVLEQLAGLGGDGHGQLLGVVELHPVAGVTKGPDLRRQLVYRRRHAGHRSRRGGAQSSKTKRARSPACHPLRHGPCRAGSSAKSDVLQAFAHLRLAALLGELRSGKPAATL